MLEYGPTQKSYEPTVANLRRYGSTLSNIRAHNDCVFAGLRRREDRRWWFEIQEALARSGYFTECVKFWQ